MKKKIASLRKLLKDKDVKEKYRLLLSDEKVQDALIRFPFLSHFLTETQSREACPLLLALALGEGTCLFHGAERVADKMGLLKKLGRDLIEIERFYSHMGGLLGYIEAVLDLQNHVKERREEKYLYKQPPTFDLRVESPELWEWCYEGTKRLKEIGEIYAVGGAGDRLNLLHEKTLEPLPAAKLLFSGRSLLEHLIRDLQGREYWHFCVFRKEVVVPVLLMTSLEKRNDEKIQEMLQEEDWYHRGRKNFLRLVQPLVPLLTSQGNFAMTGPLELFLKPGGHGVIWKLAHEKGAFRWLLKKRISSVIVRQINNPLAGLDTALFSLAGFGLEKKKAFGFASCPRKEGLAEGMNVLIVSKKAPRKATISNIEYTEFERLKKSHPHLFQPEGSPANTNVLFANLKAIEKALKRCPIPGLIVNTKHAVEIVENGEKVEKMAARLESMMQNITQAMEKEVSSLEDDVLKSHLPVFVHLHDRVKLFSATKKSFQEHKSPYETPEACFYDYCSAMRKLLERCSFSLPEVRSFDEFLKKGANLRFFYHPALGPLWSVIEQKMKGGTIKEGSELELEIAELFLRSLFLDGSFRLIAKQPIGKKADRQRGTLPRAYLKNVTIKNKGIPSSTPAEEIRRSYRREESCTIEFQGFSELYAENVVIEGPFHLFIPNRVRVRLSQGEGASLVIKKERIEEPSWQTCVHWPQREAPPNFRWRAFLLKKSLRIIQGLE